MLISAVPREYKKWFVETKQKLGELGRPNSNEVVEKMWTDHMASKDMTGVMQYIANTDRGVKTAIQFGKSNPKETTVLAVKDNGDDTITVATLDGVYTFANGSQVSQTTYKGNNVMMPIMENIQRQVAMSSISGFNMPFTPLSNAANAWASKYLLIGLSEKSGAVIGPLINKAHTAAKRKNSLYARTVNLVADGYRDSEFIGKLRVMLRGTGDVDYFTLTEAMNISYENARRTQEVLNESLPKLDKWIEKDVRSKKDRKALDVIFGRSGFIHLFDNSDIIAAINRGDTDVDGLIGMIKHNKGQLKEAENLRDYLIKGDARSGYTNARGSKTVEQLAALLALKEGDNWDVLMRLRKNSPELYTELLKLTGMVKSLHEVVHKGKKNSVGQGSGKVYTGYDGNGILDVYDGAHEYVYVTKDNINEYLKDPRWKAVRDPQEKGGELKDGELRVLYRITANSYQDGLGLDKNVIRNGIPIDSAYVKDMTSKYGVDWVKNNNIVSDSDNGYTKYRKILTAEEKDVSGLKSNIAHTLYRTWVHNAQLIEMKSVQDAVLENMVAVGDSGAEQMEKTITRNDKVDKDKQREVKPFLDVDITYEEMKLKYPNLYKRYTPVKNVSDYGQMTDKIKYVRKDMEDVVIGYPQKSLINGDTTFGVTLQRVETVYKQLVQMLKIKLVVANPAKLAMDTLSNATLLLSMDVDLGDIARGFPEGVRYATEMSNIEGRLVLAKLELAKAEAMGGDLTKYKRDVDKIEKEMKEHPFYVAIKQGFVQSQGTSMLIKEFDTISGLQKTIDDVVSLIVKDKKGDPNKAHDAIVWMMNAGFAADDILDSISNMSKIKGTSFGVELQGIAERLASKKKSDVIKDEEKRLGRKLTEDELSDIRKDADTVRYISEFIAAPSSELVRQGSRVMQMGDIAARWTLYTHEIRKAAKEAGVNVDGLDTKQLFKQAESKLGNGWDKVQKDAAMLALTTFIDYRLNIPSELKTLGDYGVLMFPGFWMRAQIVIFNLIKYHPLNAATGALITDLLGLNGASIVDANVINKVANGTIVHGGQNVLDVGTIVVGF